MSPLQVKSDLDSIMDFFCLKVCGYKIINNSWPSNGSLTLCGVSIFFLPESSIDYTVDKKVSCGVNHQEEITHFPQDQVPHGKSFSNSVVINTAPNNKCFLILVYIFLLSELNIIYFNIVCLK